MNGWLFIRYKDSDLQEYIYGFVEEDAIYEVHRRKFDVITLGSNSLVTIKPTTARDGTSDKSDEIRSFSQGDIVTGLATKKDETTGTEFVYCEFEMRTGQKAQGFIPEDFFDTTEDSMVSEQTFKH